jgi:protein-S-isoprenylcysteine O-methyltransferase Ste14
MIYFYKKNPEFLERRMRYREKEKEQRKLLKYSFLIFFIGLLIPGLDFRYHWSTVPVFLVVLSDLIILVAYINVFYVFRINQYASRIVEIEENQQVITTGPYAWVRHPMYTGVILLYLFTPLALGSFWGFIPFLMLSILILFRIKNEEEVLKKELPGYEAYCRNTKYRLIPYVW